MSCPWLGIEWSLGIGSGTAGVGGTLGSGLGTVARVGAETV